MRCQAGTSFPAESAPACDVLINEGGAWDWRVRKWPQTRGAKPLWSNFLFSCGQRCLSFGLFQRKPESFALVSETRCTFLSTPGESRAQRRAMVGCECFSWSSCSSVRKHSVQALLLPTFVDKKMNIWRYILSPTVDIGQNHFLPGLIAHAATECTKNWPGPQRILYSLSEALFRNLSQNFERIVFSFHNSFTFMAWKNSLHLKQSLW